jgi:phage terminase small subunit
MGTMPRKCNAAKGPDGLTDLQRKFCEEYVKDYNITQAYMRASGNDNYKTANTAGWKMLQLPKVKEEVARIQKAVYEAKMVNYERIAGELADIAFNSGNERNRLQAMALLQKQLGLDKIVVDANVDQTIEIKVNIDDEN